MAVPKCKVSKARRDKRRGSNWKLSAPSVAVCPKCGEPVMPHRACKACGSYNGYQGFCQRASSFLGKDSIYYCIEIRQKQ